MTFFNISSQGDLLTTTDHLSIEIAVYFGSPDQRCIMWKTIQRITEDELMDIDCVEIGFDELYLYFRSHIPSAAVPRGHHGHIWDLGNLSYIHEWEGRQKIKQAHHTLIPSDCGSRTRHKVCSIFLNLKRNIHTHTAREKIIVKQDYW